MAITLDRGKNGTYVVTGACIDIEMMVLGPIQNNTYLLSDGTALICVDPADNLSQILRAIGDRKLDAIFVTHHHADHVGALKELYDATQAPVYASAIDAPLIEKRIGDDPGMTADSCPVDFKLKDKEMVTIGMMEWKVMITPGHTPGGICFYLDSQYGMRIEDFNVLVSGDTLFAGSIGRTDFEGGDDRAMRQSLKRLSQLPDNTLVLPGHNSLTTIGMEQNRVFRFFI